MILDDGGDATMLVHLGVEFGKAGAVPLDVTDAAAAAVSIAAARERFGRLDY